MPSKTLDAIDTQDMAIETPDHDGSVLSWAKHYDERGFAPTPITKGEKGARLKDWDERRLGAAEIETTFRLDDNVGLVLGRLSGNLVLIDLDSASAVRLGGRFLPETGMVSGRPAKPDSHHFYRCDPLPPYRSFKSPKTGKAIVEILADGRQAAVAPSRLSDGEQKTWSRFHEPANADADDLLDRVTRLAVTCELEAIWPEGGRHNAALALAGGLLRVGWESDDVEGLIEYLCCTTAQPGEIRNIVRDTQAKLDADVPVTGWPTLATATGEKASIDAILDWLGISGVDLDDDRPAIKVTAGDLDKLSLQAWEALASVNDPPSLFRRSNRPARVERIDDTDTVIVRELDDTLLRHHVADAIRWYQITKGVSVPSKPPLDVIKDMGAYADIPLPVLNRVVTAPVFSPEGILQTEPGYHPEARVYYQPPAGLTVPTVSERTSRRRGPSWSTICCMTFPS